MTAGTGALTGRTVGHYAIGGMIGQGGMGIVYRARDGHLNRDVAIKVLPASLEVDPERPRRFIHEAQAASALNHPNIVTIHDVDSVGDEHFIVMELVEGDTLSDRIGSDGLPAVNAVDYAIQIADALAAAHAKGIVHRDLKPGNVMVTPAGTIKVLDFGLAKLTSSTLEATVTRTALTQAGTIVGTAAYMSPEQTEGKTVDRRSDIFAFGALLYEMLSGRRAFPGDSAVSVLSAIHRSEPQPLVLKVPHAGQLQDIVSRCLRKEPAQRFQQIDDARTQLQAWRAQALSSERRTAAARPGVRTAAAVIVLTVVGASGWFWRESRNTAWAYGQLPEVRRLAAAYDYTGALALAEETRRFIPDDGEVAQLVAASSWESTVTTAPAGAAVAIRPYGSPDGPWHDLGVTPLNNIRVPRGALEWRFSKPEYQEAHLVANQGTVNVTLARSADVPPGMVRIPGAVDFPLTLLSLSHIQVGAVREFDIGRYEVTNAQFKEFVDKGGYRNAAYWKHPFIKDGLKLSFQEAMSQFSDATGLPGPATWKLGTYPEGAAQMPVGGVSWYEAAAYAEFAGATLPSVPEWNRAARPAVSAEAVVARSNFASAGPAAANTNKSLNGFGTYDMAGNVKEWCWNEDGDGRRYILGGSWDTPGYRFIEAEALSTFNRAASNGFRLAHRTSIPPPDNIGPLKPTVIDYVHRKAASDSDFNIYASLHDYDRSSKLTARVEQTWDQLYWRKERVTFAAAYNGERMVAFLFVPKNAAPPYQTLIYWPGTGAQAASTSERLEIDAISFLVQRGRAVLYPIYKGTYERGGGEVILPGSMTHRDRRIEQYQDFARSVDYLETRSDIDRTKIGFYGLSWGGGMGAYVPAMEKRLKVSVLVHGGYRMNPYEPPVDPFHFAPRVTIPTLMLNGDYDSTFPVAVSQMPMFDQLGTPAADKKRIAFKIGHEFLPTEFAKETLAWLDRYLGEVSPR